MSYEAFRLMVQGWASSGYLPEALAYGFVVNALLAGLLIGPVLGGLGTLVVVKRMLALQHFFTQKPVEPLKVAGRNPGVVPDQDHLSGCDRRAPAHQPGHEPVRTADDHQRSG